MAMTVLFQNVARYGDYQLNVISSLGEVDILK